MKEIVQLIAEAAAVTAEAVPLLRNISAQRRPAASADRPAREP